MLIQDLTLKDSNGAAKRLAWSLHSVAIIFFCGAFLVFFQIIAYLCPRKKYSNTLRKEQIMGIIGSIIIGCLAGFCAGKLMKGGGFGLIMNLVLGLFGGVLGGWLFSQLGIEWGGILGQLGTAIVGSVAILWIASLIKK